MKKIKRALQTIFSLIWLFLTLPHQVSKAYGSFRNSIVEGIKDGARFEE